jgi:radical SAM superfamily enzyme YgiQ (UPF0313 family)
MIRLPDPAGARLNYLLVMPCQTDMRSQYYFPVGLGLVSACIKASGRAVFTLNLTYKENPEQLLRDTIIVNGIDVVATGGLSGQYSLLREVLDIAKAVNENIVTIVGGGIVTAEPAVAMEALANADYGIIGEGEITINAIAHALETGVDIGKIEGVIDKSGCIAPARAELTDLDCLPFPDYEGFEFGEMLKRKYSAKAAASEIGVTIATSRSCPYNCTFCFHSSGKRYRRRTLDNVFKELDWLRSLYSFKRLFICDELFGNDLQYANEFCNRIKPYDLNSWIQTRVDRLDNDLLHNLKQSGCVEIALGVEHVNAKILKSRRKNISIGQIETAFNQVLAAGIHPVASIIFGDLEETAESIKEALDWWGDHKHYNINLSWILTFPGSHIYKVARERGIIGDPVQYLRDGCPMVNISKMSDAEWSRMQEEVIRFRMTNENNKGELDDMEIRQTLESLLRKHKIGIWPALGDNIRFFTGILKNLPNSSNLFFVNMNTNAQWLKIANLKFAGKIHLPDVISREGIEIVICPRLDLIDEIRAICRNEYPMVKQVANISELVRGRNDEG